MEVVFHIERTAVGIDEFNQAPTEELRPTLLACCDVERFADALLAGRPYADEDAVVAAANRVASDLTPDEVERALAAHPRIGDRAEGDAREAGWSRSEQGGVSRDAETQAALAEGNRAYEARFDRVFLICATGLGGEEILAALRARLSHDDATEAAVVADELRKIAVLRVRKVLHR